MLAIFLLIFAAIAALATLAVIANSRLSGGTRVWIAIYNASVIVVMVLSALALMK
jgi:hypothetical protein